MPEGSSDLLDVTISKLDPSLDPKSVVCRLSVDCLRDHSDGLLLQFDRHVKKHLFKDNEKNPGLNESSLRDKMVLGEWGPTKYLTEGQGI